MNKQSKRSLEEQNEMDYQEFKTAAYGLLKGLIIIVFMIWVSSQF